MKLLKTIKEKDIYPDHNQNKNCNYRERTAGRVVLFDKDKNIALLHVAKSGYYKLPGGALKKMNPRLELP